VPLTVTLTTLRSRVRDRSDTTGSQRVTDPKVDAAINAAIRKLWSKVATVAEDDFTERALVVTVPDQAYACLPEDFLILRDVCYDSGASYELVGPLTIAETEGTLDEGSTGFETEESPAIVEDGDIIWMYSEDGTWREQVTAEGYETSGYPGVVLRSSTPVTRDYVPGDYAYVVRPTSRIDASVTPVARFQLQERARYSGSGSWGSSGPRFYRLVGPRGNPKRIEFLPVPPSPKVVIIWYVPTPPVLTEATDTFDGRSGFEEWVMWDAAVTILISEESDVRDAKEERDRVWTEDILPLITARDEARVDRVIDVESDGCYEEFGEP
jgi:hypothetical protein